MSVIVSSQLDLAHDARAQRMRKRPSQVHVEFARVPGVLQTLEGPVRYTAGAAVLTGRIGERWPVERGTFDRSYEPAAGTVPGCDGIYVSRAAEVLALRLDAPAAVGVGAAGDLLQGREGDWLVQYGPGDFGIVDAGVFEQAYEPAAPR